MALNKFMHPRNIYKIPPDFSKLAEKFEEFERVTKKDVLGKICIDFKDPNALRVLTKCLLKADFGLEVEIPEDRLVPTLPLRLNYILWIEDLLAAIKRKENIIGIDIGTGACSIYPLLAAVKNKWKMVGTETDEISLKMANDNVRRNDLHQLIQVKAPADNTLIEHLLNENDLVYDFCMCNPPFYSSVQELCESRSIARPPPKNAFTGSPQELITEGGELEFIRKLIAESKAHHNKVRIFTTMVGHKYNLKELQQDLKTDGLTHVSTEFCQGRVTRWGLAWTFKSYQIDKLDFLKPKPHKKPVPISYTIAPFSDSNNNLATVIPKIKNIFNELDIKYRVLYKKTDYYAMEIIAKSNTWSNQRKKRRQTSKEDPTHAKKAKIEAVNNNVHGDTASIATLKISTTNLENGDTNESKNGESYGGDEETPDINPSPDIPEDRDHSSSTLLQPASTSKTTTSDTLNVDGADKGLLVKAHVSLSNKDNKIVFEMTYLGGNGGKEALHQILQYIKNNLK